jgi:hypothetical protein
MRLYHFGTSEMVRVPYDLVVLRLGMGLVPCLSVLSRYYTLALVLVSANYELATKEFHSQRTLQGQPRVGPRTLLSPY